MKRVTWGLCLAAFISTECKSQVPASANPACPPFPPASQHRTSGVYASTSLGQSPMHPVPAIHVEIPAGPIGSVRIGLERTRCYGTCPEYRVEVRGTGEVIFEGGEFVTFSGTHETHVSPVVVQCLLDNFRTADFWSLDSEYVARVTDVPAYAVSLTIGGKTKVVTERAGLAVGMPTNVRGLEQAIDDAAGTDTWITGNDKTIAELEAEHFDFRSRAAAELLARAAQAAPDSVVFGLIDRGAPVHGRVSIEDSDEPISAIEAAAMNGRLAVVRRLIKAGVFSKGGRALVSATLRAAVASQRVAVVAEILKFHPDVNGRDASGETALSLIFMGPHPHGGEKDAPNEDAAIIRLLGKAGVSPNRADLEALLARASSKEEKDALIAIGARALRQH